jgi:hypothetical protein
MREKGLIGKRCVREKVCVIEEIMRWNCGSRNSDVVCFGDCKKFSLASNFNLYIYILDYNLCNARFFFIVFYKYVSNKATKLRRRKK